jgi:hypothetical protein
MSHTDIVRQVLKVFETMNVPEAMKLFATDAIYQFGNFPPAKGIDQIREANASSRFDFIESAAFDVKEMIEPGGGVVICEMETKYRTRDGRTVTLPCADLFRFNEQGLIKEMKIFIDPTPLLARPAAA